METYKLVFRLVPFPDLQRMIQFFSGYILKDGLYQICPKEGWFWPIEAQMSYSNAEEHEAEISKIGSDYIFPGGQVSDKYWLVCACKIGRQKLYWP